MDEETRALLVLRLVPGLGPRLTRALVEHFGSAKAVLQASAERFSEVQRLPRRLVTALKQALAQAPVEQELADITSAGAQVISWQSPDYPQALRPLPDSPPILYIRGKLGAQEPCLAVVGSRLCTNYGRRIAERLVAGLVRAGFTIVSGLARGIDAIAHQAALANGGRTVAVFAGGLLCVYPPEHRELAEAIAQRGALVSEQPMRMPPERTLFPARNRLISGLCQGVVIIEASDQSGALITARHAAEQGRDVFVVPGPIDSPTSGGIVQLLRQGAWPVRDAEDIVAVLRGQADYRATGSNKAGVRTRLRVVDPPLPSGLSKPANSPPLASEASRRSHLSDWDSADTQSPETNKPELAQSRESVGEGTVDPPMVWPEGTPEYVRQLYAALRHEPLDVDILAAQTGLSAQDLARAVVHLEMQGLLRRLPGNRLARRF
ncbi:DNA processing protein DprA [bacterium HR36]|nr:DNA processing protein DprA [bacterium HR36]